MQASRLDFSGMVRERMRHGHPPLYYSVTWLVRRAAGEGEFALRAPAALAGLASAAVLGLLLARLGHPWLGVLAAFMLLASYPHMRVAQMTRPYTLVQLLSLLSTWVLIADAGRDRRKNAVLFGALSALNLYCHFSAGFVVASQALYLVTRRPFPRRLVAALGVAVVLFSPAIAAFSHLTSVDTRLGWVERMGGRPQGFFARVYVGGRHALAWPVSALVVGVALLGARRLGRTGLPLTALFVGPPLLAGVMSLLGFVPVYTVGRYFATTTAAQMGLVAGALAGPPSRSRWILTAVVALGCAQAFGPLEYYFERGPRPSWRAAAREIEERRGANEVVALQSARGGAWQVFLHYMPEPFYEFSRPGRPPRSRERPRPERLASGDSDLLAIPDDARGVWIATEGLDGLSDEEQRVLDDLVARFPEAETYGQRRSFVVHRWRGE